MFGRFNDRVSLRKHASFKNHRIEEWVVRNTPEIDELWILRLLK